MLLCRLLMLFLQVFIFYPVCEASNGEKRLFDDLFANYSTEVRPRHNSSLTVVITVELDLVHIKNLDEQAEVMYTSAIIEAEWKDDYLSWKPQNYDGVQELVVSPTRVWLPDIGVQNSAGKFYDDDYFELFRVHVHHTGEVRWGFGGVMETSCHLDGTLFPFDSQACSIVVQSWAYSEAFVDLRNSSSVVHLENFNDDDIWSLVGSVARRELNVYGDHGVIYPRVVFVIYLDRKPLFYVVNVIIPVMFLVLVVLMVYWLPPDSGDKISLSITVLLSFSVLLFVVTDSIPASSEHTPVLGVFVMVTMAVSTASVIESIIVMRICSIQATTMSPVLRFIAFRLVGRALCISRPSQSSVVDDRDDHGRKTECQPNSDVQQQLLGDIEMSGVAKNSSELVEKINDVLVELRKVTGRQQKTEAEAEIAAEWRDLGGVIDRLLFVVSLVVLSSVTLWMVAKSSQPPVMHGDYDDDQ